MRFTLPKFSFTIPKLNKSPYRLAARPKQGRDFAQLRKHPVALPLAIVLPLTFLTLAVFLTVHFIGGDSAIEPTNSKIVIVSYDKKKETIPTTASTVGQLLTKLDIKLEAGDVVEPARSTQIVEDNFHVNVYRSLPVTIVDGQKRIHVDSAATTPRSIAKQAGVTTYPEDNMRIEIHDNFIGTGEIGQNVVIDRATPVFVNLYGTTITLRSHAKTVNQLLKDKKIKIAKDDVLQPVADTPLTDNTQVFVSRKGIKIATAEEPIAYPSQTIEDASLSFGTTVVRQAGTAGKRVVTYQIETKNDVEVGRTAIQSIVATEPVGEIIARGKAVQIPADKESAMAQAGISSGDYAYVNYIVSHEGGWCPTKLQGQYGVCPAYAPASIPGGLGYGICQATPGTKMASAGGDWQTNVVTQLRWCSGYATGRYGSWSAAYNFWTTRHYW